MSALETLQSGMERLMLPIVSKVTSSKLKTIQFPITSFDDGSATEIELLGDKGAETCEMLRQGLPVPQGFILNAATMRFLDKENNYEMNDELWAYVRDAVVDLEANTLSSFSRGRGNLIQGWNRSRGKSRTSSIFHSRRGSIRESIVRGVESLIDELKTSSNDDTGDVDLLSLYGKPLTLAVRLSTSKRLSDNVPYVINIGINEELLRVLTERDGEESSWAYKAYIQFIVQYGIVVMGMESSDFSTIIKESVSSSQSLEGLSLGALQELVKKLSLCYPVPQNPWSQLQVSINAFYRNWYSDQSKRYRVANNLSCDEPLALIVQCCVHGNYNKDSGCGFAFSHNPISGDHRLEGQFAFGHIFAEFHIANQTHKLISLSKLAKERRHIYDTLFTIVGVLERQCKDMQHVEFVVEDNVLFIVSRSNGRRSPDAAANIAVELVNARVASEREALLTIDNNNVTMLTHTYISAAHNDKILIHGIGYSPGAACGALCFNERDIQSALRTNCPILLILNSVSKDDLVLLEHASGLIVHTDTENSCGVTYMRQRAKPVVRITKTAYIDTEHRRLYPQDGGLYVGPKQIISIDGFTGNIYREHVQEEILTKAGNVEKLLKWADRYKNMHLFGIASTEEDVKQALSCGSEGLILDEVFRQQLQEAHQKEVYRLLFATSTTVQQESAKVLVFHLKRCISPLLYACAEREVIMKVFDEAAAEFLPIESSPHFSRDIAEMSEALGCSEEHCRMLIRDYQEQTASMGTRGARVCLLFPALLDVYVTAVCETLIECNQNDIHVFVHLLMIHTMHENEVELLADLIDRVCSRVCLSKGLQRKDICLDVGVSIDVPRACLRIDKFVSGKNISFVSFDLDRLTELVYGISADSYDFLDHYQDKLIIGKNPFVALDLHGVGSFVQIARKKLRQSHPHMKCGVYGQHLHDLTTISFLSKLGVDFLACYAPLISLTKIKLAQASIAAKGNLKWRHQIAYEVPVGITGA